MNKTIKSIIVFGVTAFVVMFCLNFGQQVAKHALWPGLAIMALGLVVGGFVLFRTLWGDNKVVSADPAERERALSWQPTDGNAAIYIVRKGFVAKLRGIDFVIEGIGRGQAKGNQFLYVEVPAGTYHIGVDVVGSSGGTDVTLIAGEIAIFRVAVVMGMTAGTVTFARLDVETGRTELASAQMVHWQGVDGPRGG